MEYSVNTSVRGKRHFTGEIESGSKPGKPAVFLVTVEAAANSFHFRGGRKYYASCPLHNPLSRGVEVLCFLPSTHYPLYDFDLRATHARTLLPAALASVSFGFVLVRVRLRSGRGKLRLRIPSIYHTASRKRIFLLRMDLWGIPNSRTEALWKAICRLVYGMWKENGRTLGHVRLISFLGLVCAALLFFSTC